MSQAVTYALILCLANVQATRITVPEVQFLMFFLNFSTLQEEAGKNVNQPLTSVTKDKTNLAERTGKLDEQLVSAGFQCILHGNSVRDKLVIGPVL